MNPRKNRFGNLFSTNNPLLLKDELGICDGDKVLDVGCGENPLPWAQYHLDSDFEFGYDRDGKTIPAYINPVRGDVCAIPFPDKTFEWVCCVHVLEHVGRPDIACKELMRVAKRGFIETPWKGSELFAGYPSHRWLISLDANNTLVFEPRTFIEHPLENFVMAQAQRNHAFRNLCLDTMRNLTCVQFVWEDGFNFEIKNTCTEIFDYTNPDHAGRSHASYALNLLRHGAPVENTLFHTEYALQINHSSKYVVHVAAIVFSMLHKFSDAAALLDSLETLWGNDEAVSINLPILRSAPHPAFGNLVCPGKADEILFYELNNAQINSRNV